MTATLAREQLEIQGISNLSELVAFLPNAQNRNGTDQSAAIFTAAQSFNENMQKLMSARQQMQAGTQEVAGKSMVELASSPNRGGGMGR